MAMDEKRGDSYKELWRYISESKLLLMRNLSFGGAGLCIATLLVLTQVGLKDWLLTTALVAASVAMPFWVALASAFEIYIFLGKRTYSHFRSDQTTRALMSMMLVAAGGLVVAVTSLICHLSNLAAECFALAALVAIVTYVRLDHGAHKQLRLKRCDSDEMQ